MSVSRVDLLLCRDAHGACDSFSIFATHLQVHQILVSCVEVRKASHAYLRGQEPAEQPTILPTNVEKKPVTISNTNAWASLADENDDEPAQEAGGGGSLWSQFQEKDSMNKQREEEKIKEEERERERKAAELKRQEEDKAEQARLKAEKVQQEAKAAERQAEEDRIQREVR